MKKNTHAEIELKKTSEKSPLVGVLFVLVSIAVYVLYSTSLAEGVSIKEDELSQKLEMEVELLQEIEDIKSAEEAYGVSTEVHRRDSLKAIPTEMNQDEVIRDVIEITDEYKITLNSISFGESASGNEGVSSLRVNASFEGDYSDLVSFLKGIEKNGRLMIVDTISVQVISLEISDIERATFSLSMQAYYQN